MRPHLTWMETAMHDMGSLATDADRPSRRLGKASSVPGRVEEAGLAGAEVPVVWSFNLRFWPLLFEFVVGGLRCVFCVSIVGWRHDSIRSECLCKTE